MRRFQGHILALSCATLLLLQMVGLHLHSSPDAQTAALHAEHVHGADPDGHDHSADRDVSLIQYGTFWAKLVPLLLPLLPGLMAVLLIRWIGRAPGFPGCLPDSISRWRPPLRAPPIPA